MPLNDRGERPVPRLEPRYCCQPLQPGFQASGGLPLEFEAGVLQPAFPSLPESDLAGPGCLSQAPDLLVGSGKPSAGQRPVWGLEGFSDLLAASFEQRIIRPDDSRRYRF
jgi:hypothetical protein